MLSYKFLIYVCTVCVIRLGRRSGLMRTALWTGLSSLKCESYVCVRSIECYQTHFSRYNTYTYVHTCHAMPFHSIDVWMLCISVMCRYCMYVCMYVCVVVVVVLQVYRGSSDSNCQSVAYTRLKTIDILPRGQPALPVLRLCMYACICIVCMYVCMYLFLY